MIKFNDRTISDIWFGDRKVVKVYQGSSLIYGPSAALGRMWYVNFINQYGNDVEDPDRTWNDFKISEEALETPGMLTLNLKSEDGSTSTLTFTNHTPFDGANVGYADYITDDPVFPVLAVNSGIAVTEPSTFRIGGLDNSKKYTMFLYGCADYDNASVTIEIQGQVKERVVSHNYPIAGEGTLTNSAIDKFTNLTPSAGNIDVNIDKSGDFYQSNVNFIIIAEQ